MNVRDDVGRTPLFYAFQRRNSIEDESGLELDDGVEEEEEEQEISLLQFLRNPSAGGRGQGRRQEGSNENRSKSGCLHEIISQHEAQVNTSHGHRQTVSVSSIYSFLQFGESLTD